MADISKVLVGESEHDIKDTTARAVMTGATSSTAGTAGRVPAPSAGDNEKFLRGDGTWHDVDTAPTYTFDTVAEMNAAIQAGTVPANGAVVYCKEDVPMGNEGDTSLDTTSTNWVQNQAVATAVNGKADHAVIAAVDNASTASKAFTKGEYIYHNGVLYTAYRDISQGDTFVAQGEGGEYNLIEAVIGDDLYTVTVNVAPIESSYFTSKEYYKGQYFWWQGKLYKATAFISRGTNISSANKEATTVDSELYALNTSLAKQIVRTGVTASAGGTVRIPASGTDSRIATTSVVMPICDDNSGKPVKFTSCVVSAGYVTITMAEAISNKNIGVVVINQ